MDRMKIKEILLNDIKCALKNSFNYHNVGIEIKNLNEAVDIVSNLLGEIWEEEKIHDLPYYIDISFNVVLSPQKLYVMNYLSKVYDGSFFFWY